MALLELVGIFLYIKIHSKSWRAMKGANNNIQAELHVIKNIFIQ